MPRSRGSDVPQRQSPRAPLHLKTTACSEANSVHHRPVAADRSPKVSPRGALQERKRGMRVADLEIKLSKAQGELKKLREQLASAEAAKLEAEQALVKAKKRIPATAPTAKGEEEKPPLPRESPQEGDRQQESKAKEESVISPATMDVFEVVVPTEPVHGENEAESNQQKEERVVDRDQEEETKTMIEKTKSDEGNAAEEEEKEKEEEDRSEPVVLSESPELDTLKAKLLEKEKEVAILLEENVIFKTKAEDEAKQITDTAQAKEEELMAKLNSMEEELKESRAKADRLAEQLEAAEGSKEALEVEMKRLRVQTDQWRKAAEAAAAVLATGEGTCDDMGGRRVAERCRSMDKHVEAGYVGWGSPLMAGDMDDDSGGSGRRKSAGIRMLGNLWKKNQHK